MAAPIADRRCERAHLKRDFADSKCAAPRQNGNPDLSNRRPPMMQTADYLIDNDAATAA
jgi:hypothetical protein